MAVPISTRWFLDRKHVAKRIGAAQAKVLRKIGAIVYRSVQGEFLSRRQSRGTSRQIGSYRGLPLIERRRRTARRGRITSWKSPRSPKGFMRASMAFAYDPSAKSVVIGPRYNGWLNELHERGGSVRQRLYLRYRGRPVPLQRAYGLRRRGAARNYAYVGTFFDTPPSTNNFRVTGRSRSVRVRPSRFQLGGLRKVLGRIPQQFRNQISGP